jgi:hypothetical protein
MTIACKIGICPIFGYDLADQALKVLLGGLLGGTLGMSF